MSCRRLALCLFAACASPFAVPPALTLADDSQASPAAATLNAARLFRERIAPVFAARCLACHDQKQEGGYSLATAAKLLVAGDSEKTPVVANKPEESELWRRLVSADAAERMPVDAAPLSAEQIEAVKTWILAGAPLDQADAEQPLARIAIARRVSAPAHYSRPISVNTIALAQAADEIYVGGYAEVTRWNFRSGELLSRMPVAGPHVAGIDVNLAGNYLMVSSGSPGQRGLVEMIAIANPTAARATLEATADIAPDLAFSPTDNRAVIGGLDGGLRVVEILGDSRFGPVATLTPHADAILAVAWSADGRSFVTASRDRTAKLFDATKLEVIASYDRHERAVGGVAFLGKHPLSLDETGRLRLMVGDDSDAVVAEQSALPRALQRFATTGDEVFIADRNKLRRIRTEQKSVDNGKDEAGQLKTKQVTRFREGDAFEIVTSEWITAVAANENTVAAGSQEGRVTVWHRSTRQKLGEFVAKP